MHVLVAGTYSYLQLHPETCLLILGMAPPRVTPTLPGTNIDGSWCEWAVRNIFRRIKGAAFRRGRVLLVNLVVLPAQVLGGQQVQFDFGQASTC
jgi:hypothetical protein